MMLHGCEQVPDEETVAALLQFLASVYSEQVGPFPIAESVQMHDPSAWATPWWLQVIALVC
jgi:hypothetical protein